MKKIFVLGLLSFHISYASTYDSYQSFQSKPVSLSIDFQYTKTSTNFDADGSKTSLPSGNSFQDINFAPRMRWQFADLALLGGFNIGNSESSDPLFTRKNSVINKIDLASEYLFAKDVWYRVFGRLIYVHPLEKIDYSGDTVSTSDGAYELNPEVIVNLDFEGDFYSFLKGGVVLRGEGLSTLGTYGIGSEWHFSEYAIGAALLGQMTLKEDTHTSDPLYRDNYNNRVNAGSKIFNSINPTAHNLEFNFNFSYFKVYAGTQVMGSNTSQGFYMGLKFNWIFDYTPDYSTPTHRMTTPPPVFKEKTDDGVDQKYFKPVQPLSQDYIQQLQGPKKNLDEATKPEEEDGVEINTKPVQKTNPNYKIKLRKTNADG